MPAGRMMLSAPVRLYWELAPVSAGGLDEDTVLDFAEELVRMKVFFVTLRLRGGVRPDLPAILSRLRDGGINARLSVCDTSSLPDPDTASLGDGIDIYIDAPEGGLAGRLNELYEACSNTSQCRVTSVSAVPSVRNASGFTDFLNECVRLGITAISLPNPTVTGGDGTALRYVLDPAARSEIKSAVESVLKPRSDTVKLFVHDLFLYMELDMPGLSERTEYAGCQAAEALAYVSRDGTVYPCASWPEPIGDLKEASFGEIWTGEKRREVAERIGRLPDICRECNEHDKCHAGCRGLAYAIYGEDGPDPACPKQ